MSATFIDHVRGLTDEVPEGHDPRGLRVYRHLVWLGASQMVQACFPDLRGQLGESAWDLLIADFVKRSQWSSHSYGDLEHEFQAYLARTLAEPSA